MQPARTRTACLAMVVAMAAACSDRSTPPPTVAMDLPDVRRLCERLDRLIDGLEHASPATGAPVEARRIAAEDDVPALQARIAALELELTNLRNAAHTSWLPAGTGGRPMVIAPQRGGAVTRAIASLRADGEKDTNETLRSLLLLNPAQVVEQFGMPDKTYIRENGAVRWSYLSDGDEISVDFVNGQVMRVH